MNTFVLRLRENFESVRARTADIVERQDRILWLKHWLEEGNITYEDLGTTFEDMRALWIEYEAEHVLNEMPIASSYVM